MSAGLRAWVASHSETRWAIAVAMVCVALVGGTLLWPETAKQAVDSTSTTVRMPVQTPPEPVPEPSSKPVTLAKPTAKPGEASAPLPAKTESVTAAKPTTTAIPKSAASKPAAPSTATTTGHGWFVQVGAFRDRQHAELLRSRLAAHRWPTHIQEKKGNILAVWVGAYSSKNEADKQKKRLADQEKMQGFLVSH